MDRPNGLPTTPPDLATLVRIVGRIGWLRFGGPAALLIAAA